MAKVETSGTNKEDVQSTGGQTLSMFNERKKNNNMIGNAAYGDEFDATSHDDEEFRDLGRSQSIY